MVNISFLILNYKNIDDTIKCVQSIMEASYESFDIVIVDNGSNDGSYETMKRKYGNISNIHLIKSNNNLGFSKGNNLGYEYIRNNLDPDFVVVTNNDVLFPQKDMDKRIEEIYSETKFHVLGPDIYVRANHEHQSPMMLKLPSKKDLENELSMYEYYLNHPKKWVHRRKLQNIKNRICQSNSFISMIYNKLKKKENIDYGQKFTNCCVQGACIIISSDYLKAEEKMFSPEPFLYGEELLLYRKCIDKGYTVVYNPDIQIWHEDSSTMRKINSDNLQKAKFTLPHHVAALKLLLENWN